jgi:hypothetical protein
VVIESPDLIFPLEKIGSDGCLCGLPGRQGHPVVISGDREFVEFTADEYDYLFGDPPSRSARACSRADDRTYVRSGLPSVALRHRIEQISMAMF